MSTDERPGIEHPAFTGRILTADEIAFCNAMGLEHGFDDDAEDKHQFSHVCWPSESGFGALCQSDRLWFQHGFGGSVEPDRVDCEICLTRLDDLKTRDPLLCAVIGRLATRTTLLAATSCAADNFLWVMDHPDEARILGEGALAAERGRLDEALARDLEPDSVPPAPLDWSKPHE